MGSQKPLKGRQLVNMQEVEKYCKPQQLNVYNPEASGFKYEVLGLFGIPD